MNGLALMMNRIIQLETGITAMDMTAVRRNAEYHLDAWLSKYSNQQTRYSVADALRIGKRQGHLHIGSYPCLQGWRVSLIACPVSYGATCIFLGQPLSTPFLGVGLLSLSNPTALYFYLTL